MIFPSHLRDNGLREGRVKSKKKKDKNISYTLGSTIWFFSLSFSRGEKKEKEETFLPPFFLSLLSLLLQKLLFFFHLVCCLLLLHPFSLPSPGLFSQWSSFYICSWMLSSSCSFASCLLKSPDYTGSQKGIRFK